MDNLTEPAFTSSRYDYDKYRRSRHKSLDWTFMAKHIMRNQIKSWPISTKWLRRKDS